MTEAEETASLVNTLKKRISEELTDIDKNIEDMEKTRKESVEKIEIKKVELKEFSNTQDVCDEHYATLKEIEQAGKLIEERKSSITNLDATITNLDVQIAKIQAEHDKAVAELEKKRRKLDDYLKYYEDLNDKLEKLIQLLSEEELKHCIELNELKVERAKTLQRTDLSEHALNKQIEELDNKVDNLNKEHGKLIESISEKLSEITVDATSVEELLSDGKKDQLSLRKKKRAKKGDVDADGKSVDISDDGEVEEISEEEFSDDEELGGEPGKKDGRKVKERPSQMRSKGQQPADKSDEMDKQEGEKEQKERAKEGSSFAGSGRVGSSLAGSGRVGSSLAGSGRVGSSLAGSKKVGSSLAGSGRVGSSLAGSGRLGSSFAGSRREGSSFASSAKEVTKRDKKGTPKKTKKKKGKLYGKVEDTFDIQDEEEDWLSARERELPRDLRLDLLRKGYQITPSNRIITPDDRILTLEEARHLGILDFSEYSDEEEEFESSETDEYGWLKRKKKKSRYDKHVKYYKSPASSASSLGKESSDSRICGRDIEYLKDVFGKSLTIALAELIAIQPIDPIHYLAQWLLKYRYNQEIEEVTRIQIQELMIEQERLAAEKWHRELQEEARLAVLEALFRAENIIIQQDYQSRLGLHEYEGEFEDSPPPAIV